MSRRHGRVDFPAALERSACLVFPTLLSEQIGQVNPAERKGRSQLEGLFDWRYRGFEVSSASPQNRAMVEPERKARMFRFLLDESIEDALQLVEIGCITGCRQR